MTTKAATSSATSTSSTDDSNANHNNDGVAPGQQKFGDDRQKSDSEKQEQHNRNEDSLDNVYTDDGSKNLNRSPAGTRTKDQPQHDDQSKPPLDASAIIPANNSAVTASPTTSSLSSTPPSASVANEGTSDVRRDQSPPIQHQSTTSSNTATTTPSAGSNTNNTEQKRPMNAFLLFCKRQRSQVREKYPNLENRGITKILGDWWTKLDKEQKSKYTDLARQHKEAFMKANPDFKWCKTPTVSNLNNNNGNNTNSSNDNCTNNLNNEQKHQHFDQASQQQQPHLQHKIHPSNKFLYNQHLNQPQQNHHSLSTINVELLSIQSLHNNSDVMRYHHSSNHMDMSLLNRQQVEAPKPPKKRFLERTDSIYSSKDNNFISNRNDTNIHGADIVPCISLDQDILDRVIDKAFSEDSSSSKPSGTNNSCKCSNRNTMNLTIPLSTSSNNSTSFSSTTTATSSASVASTTTTSASQVPYPMSIDEPVDFSMNRTINTTRQQIINNLVEKMLSEPSDEAPNSFSKINGTDSSSKGYAGPPVKKDKSDAT